jgi:pimeloyl-ACP methyl ester carboxylesterase
VAGYRVIGVDRPGHGPSTPQPGRTIAGWVPDGPALHHALGAEQCVDDRIADGVGWESFDVSAGRAPTIVLHGGDDSLVNVGPPHRPPRAPCPPDRAHAAGGVMRQR